MEAYHKSLVTVEKDKDASSLLTSPLKVNELKDKMVCLSAQNTQESTTSNSSPVKSLEKNYVSTSMHDEAVAVPINEEVKEGESKLDA